MSRPIQYLKKSPKATAEQTLTWLEDYASLVIGAKKPKLSKRKLISMKVEIQLLRQFKLACAKEGIPYQTKIQELMKEWIKES